MAAWTAARSAEDATEVLQAASVPAHPVANSVEAFADPQLRHRQHFVEVPHGKLGTTWIEGGRFVLSRTPAVMRRAGPTFGEDTFESSPRRSATTTSGSPTSPPRASSSSRCARAVDDAPHDACQAPSSRQVGNLRCR
ncbi:MAG: hypothetical protein GEV08_13450 [Acidimicrobiia bacterium]|nr:hypothetical protein [Acidimicrobiia bacterium]